MSLLRTSAVRTALRASKQRVGVSGMAFTRGKATLPDLACMFASIVLIFNEECLVRKSMANPASFQTTTPPSNPPSRAK